MHFTFAWSVNSYKQPHLLLLKDYFSKCDLQYSSNVTAVYPKPPVEFVLLDPAMGHGKLVRSANILCHLETEN